jgi:hypothetical protein
MANMYGEVEGARGPCHRLGGSHLRTTAASWQGGVRVQLTRGDDGVVSAHVELIPWHGAGVNRVLYAGPVSGSRRRKANPQQRSITERYRYFQRTDEVRGYTYIVKLSLRTNRVVLVYAGCRQWHSFKDAFAHYEGAGPYHVDKWRRRGDVTTENERASSLIALNAIRREAQAWQARRRKARSR